MKSCALYGYIRGDVCGKQVYIFGVNQVMAKTLLFFKVILFSITVLDRLSNVDSVSIKNQGLSTNSSTTSPTTPSESSNSFQIIWNQTSGTEANDSNVRLKMFFVLKLNFSFE